MAEDLVTADHDVLTFPLQEVLLLSFVGSPLPVEQSSCHPAIVLCRRLDYQHANAYRCGYAQRYERLNEGVVGEILFDQRRTVMEPFTVSRLSWRAPSPTVPVAWAPGP